MTEEERQAIIELVHTTVLGFFEFTDRKTEKVLLKVNKAICNKIKEMPTDRPPERPHGKWENDRLEKHTLHVGDCSKCGEKGVIGNFCMWCGSDNRVKEGE